MHKTVMHTSLDLSDNKLHTIMIIPHYMYQYARGRTLSPILIVGSTSMFCLSSSVKEELSPILSVANMIEFLLKSFLGITRLCSKPGSFPKGPVEVSCDVTPHFMVYLTAVETRTNSSGMCTHTGQHSWLPCMHIPIFA